MLVSVDQLITLPCPHGRRNDLLGEDPVLLSGHRALMRCHRELVLRLPGNAVLTPQILRGFQHSAGHRVVPPAARRNAGAVQEAFQRGDAEVNGRQRFEHSAVAPDWRPNRFADHGFAYVHMNLPPVTSSTVPVMYDDRSLAKNSATLATSLGSPA